MHDIDVGHALEQFAGEVIGRTVAGRGEIEFARLLLRQHDQLLYAARRHAGVDDQHDGRRRKQRDWSEVLGRIEGKLAVEGLVDGERAGRGEQERVAVRLRLGDEIAARVAAAARAVLDDDLLSEIVGSAPEFAPSRRPIRPVDMD